MSGGNGVVTEKYKYTKFHKLWIALTVCFALIVVGEIVWVGSGGARIDEYWKMRLLFLPVLGFVFSMFMWSLLLARRTRGIKEIIQVVFVGMALFVLLAVAGAWLMAW